MKNTIKTIFAAAALISTVNLNASADNNIKMIGAYRALPASITVADVLTPEAIQSVPQRVYTPAQKAAIVELYFTSQKQTTFKAADFLIGSIPANEITAPSTVQQSVENMEYVPAQKASIVELTF